jgi:hypothetical protein
LAEDQIVRSCVEHAGAIKCLKDVDDLEDRVRRALEVSR